MAKSLSPAGSNGPVVDIQTRIFVDRILMVVGAIGVVVAIVGEVLGWWPDL